MAFKQITEIMLLVYKEKFMQFDWLRAVVFQLNLKYLHCKCENYKPFAGTSIHKI